MGHANLTNLSQFWNSHLYAKGKLSLWDCATAAIKQGETVHASEGEYDDIGMICYGLEFVVEYLWDNDIIEPVDLTQEQKMFLEPKLDDGEFEDEEDCEILDSILWKYSAGQRHNYPDIPILSNITV